MMYCQGDENVPHNHKQALFIYNLEPAYMSGSHWVATYVKDNVINYFDSFWYAPISRDCQSCQKEKFNSITPKQSDTKHTNNNLWVFLFILSK